MNCDLFEKIEHYFKYVSADIRYQIMALELLAPLNGKSCNSSCGSVELHVPSGFNMLENPDHASQAALWGIEVS
jgi:hypothetical protein